MPKLKQKTEFTKSDTNGDTIVEQVSQIISQALQKRVHTSIFAGIPVGRHQAVKQARRERVPNADMAKTLHPILFSAIGFCPINMKWGPHIPKIDKHIQDTLSSSACWGQRKE